VPRLNLPITLLLACTVLVLSVRVAHGQSTFGSIRGTVQDASGAVIPGALVTLRSLDENFDRKVTTNDRVRDIEVNRCEVSFFGFIIRAY
jgi:hypothetical protein